MVEGGEDLGFTLEALHALFVASEGLREDLDRHLALQLRVARPVDLAHPPRAQKRDELIGTEPLSGRQGHDGLSGVSDGLWHSVPGP